MNLKDHKASPGERVLVEATVSADGHVSIAPGVELKAASVKVVAGLPAFGEGLDDAVGLLLLFNNEQDRDEFAAVYSQGESVTL